MDILVLSIIAGIVVAGGLWIASRDEKPAEKRPVLLDVIEVKPRPDHTLVLTFEGGQVRRFDMTPLLTKKPFQPLQDRELFQQARIEYGTVTWPGDIDIAPETLFARSIPVEQ